MSTNDEDQVTPEDEAYWAAHFREMQANPPPTPELEQELYWGLLAKAAPVQRGEEFLLLLRVAVLSATDLEHARTQFESVAALEHEQAASEVGQLAPTVALVGRCGPVSVPAGAFGWVQIAFANATEARAFLSGSRTMARFVLPSGDCR